MNERSDGPLGPADATRWINEKAKHDDLELLWTGHIKDQMRQRGLIQGDVLHLLKTGFVFEDPEPATRPGFWKYRIEGTTPNSKPRQLRMVVIPSSKRAIKLVTMMWLDED